MKNAEASAPGRICLAGEDIDWMSGPSILCAIDLRTTATVKTKTVDDGLITLKTGNPFNTTINAHLEAIGNYSGGVLDYVQASLKVITDLGVSPKPMTLEINSNLPAKGGLSSSAAVCVATLAALSKYYDLNQNDQQIADLAYKVERDELKTGAGQMDMYSSALGGLIYLDSSTVPPRSIERYQFPRGLDIIIVDSLTPRSTSDAIREKRRRYESKEPNIFRYITETETAIENLRTIFSLQPFDLEKMGSLISACHVYMRDFLQVSTGLIDECVAISKNNGAIGAKLTGTGMGGCMFALIPSELTDKVVPVLQEKPVKVFVTKPASRGIIADFSDF